MKSFKYLLTPQNTPTLFFLFKQALVFAVLSALSLSARSATVVANFTDGNTNASIDGYIGKAGSGWLAGWNPIDSSSVLSGTVTGASPINQGGNYLSASLAISGTTSNTGMGAMGRKFDRAIVSSTTPYTVKFDLRPESQLTSSSDKILVFGDVSSGYVFSTGTGNTFCIQGVYNSGSPTWLVTNSGSAVNTGMAMTQGSVYGFTVNVDPASRSYTVAIASTGTTYQSGSMAFRASVSDGGNALYLGGIVRNTTGTITYSVDNISIAPTATQPVVTGFPAAIDADFTAGNLATHTDGYKGIAGAGWLASWNTTTSSSTMSGTVATANPLQGGGNYLSTSLSISGTSSNTGMGTVARRFDTRTIDSTAPYVVSFDVRLDTALTSSSDKLLLFGDVSSSYAFSTGTNNTYCIQGVYNSGSPTWLVTNSGSAVSTGMPMVQGSVYNIVVNVDPPTHSYKTSITSGTTVYQSGTMNFRSTALNGGSTLYFGGVVRNTTGTITFSLDNVHVKPVSTTAGLDFPAKIVPNINGIATHFNTEVDFGMSENSSAMDQMRDAGWKFTRYNIPWSDIERTQGVFAYTNNANYTPGYLSGENAFVSRGLRPIICLAFANSIYGLSQTTPITTTDGLAAFQNYCYNVAKQFRNDNPIFEIWNEPNIASFGGYTSTQYLTLVNSAITGVITGWREGRDTPDLADPIIIGPAVSGAWYSGNFFDHTLDLGIMDKVDALSFHPYMDPGGGIPENVAPLIDNLKSTLVARGRPNMPLVITEWGWSTGGFTDEVSEATQAKFAARQVLMGYYTGLAVNCIYSLEDARNDDNRTTAGKHYGMFKTMGADYQKTMTAKAAVSSVTAVNSSLTGHCYVQKVDMGSVPPLNSTKDWCLVFWNPTTGTAKAAVWTTDTSVTKTTPDLRPLLNLNATTVVNFTDSPVFIDLPGYHP